MLTVDHLMVWVDESLGLGFGARVVMRYVDGMMGGNEEGRDSARMEWFAPRTAATRWSFWAKNHGALPHRCNVLACMR